jgi:hypothetical protein
VERSGGGATVPRGYCSRARGGGLAARSVRGAGNGGRGASSTAGKREGFPSNLLLLD